MAEGDLRDKGLSSDAQLRPADQDKLHLTTTQTLSKRQKSTDRQELDSTEQALLNLLYQQDDDKTTMLDA